MAGSFIFKSDTTQKVCAVLLIACAIIPFLGQPYLTRLATQFLIYAMVAISLDLLIGYGGMVSFGHAAFFGLGSYAAAFIGLSGSHDLLLALIGAFVAGAALSLVVGALSLRTSGSYFIMITLAFAQMLFYASVVLAKFGGDEGVRVPRNTLFGLALRDSRVFFAIVFVIFLIVFYLIARLVRSQFGRTIRAIKDNDVRVRSLGYNSYVYQLTAFCIAGGVAGLAGALQANLNEYASPSSFHWILSGDFLVMVILGGVGSLAGPVVGTALFLGLQALFSAYTPFWMLWMAPILLVIVLFSSGGVRQLLNKLGIRQTSGKASVKAPAKGSAS